MERLVATAGRRVRVRALGGARRGEMRLTRFLRNEAVTPQEMIETQAAGTAPRCAGRHVLAIQDTTVIRSQGGGGLYLHAMIAVDAQDGAILGAIHGQFLSRSQGKRGSQRTKPIGDKESHRWLQGADRAGKICASAQRITVIADRESDIYEAFAQRPAPVDLLIRACKDRHHGETSLFAHGDALPVAARVELDLPARPGRRARRATLALRLANVELRRPRHGVYGDAPASLRVNLVDVREVDAPEGEPPLHWRLLTTIPVENAADAFEVVGLYRRRWGIEQLFRAMKTQGFDVEGLLIDDETPLRNMAMAIFIAAVAVQQLVHARDGAGEQGEFRPVTDAFDAGDQPLLQAFNAQLEGKTEKQKNPHPKGSLAYASWICARLGGWNCYYGKPGPITMLNGWREFQAAKRGVAAIKAAHYNV